MSDLCENKVTLFCKVCEYLTVTNMDIASKINTGTCRECEFKFVQPNLKKWNLGWRPSRQEVLLHRKDIKKRIYSILSEINNYI